MLGLCELTVLANTLIVLNGFMTSIINALSTQNFIFM